MKAILLGIFAAVTLFAQAPAPEQVTVRMLSVKGPEESRLPVQEVLRICTEAGLTGEHRMTPSQLGTMVAECAQAIEQHYRERGRSVRVAYEVEPVPPRTVAVTFRVIENAR